MVITGLDFIVVIIMLISALLAMVRGLTREVLSIASWAVAALATLYFFPRFQEDVRAMLQPNILADVSLAVGIFLITLILVSFITMRISDFILDSRIGAIDRTLGFLFGLARGLLLVVVAFMFFAWLVPPQNQPRWIADARSRPLLERTGESIISLLPEDPERAILDRLRGTGEGPGADGTTTGGATGADDGLGTTTDQDGMDALIDSTREQDAAQ